MAWKPGLDPKFVYTLQYHYVGVKDKLISDMKFRFIEEIILRKKCINMIFPTDY